MAPPTPKPSNTSYEKDKMAFSADTVAVILAAQGIGTIGMKAYELMSRLDGSRTANSFQHQFRPVVKRAKELKGQLEGGSVEGVTPKKRGKADSEQATPSKKPRATTKGKKVANATATPPSRKKQPITTESDDNDNKDDDDEDAPSTLTSRPVAGPLFDAQMIKEASNDPHAGLSYQSPESNGGLDAGFSYTFEDARGNVIKQEREDDMGFGGYV